MVGEVSVLNKLRSPVPISFRSAVLACICLAITSACAADPGDRPVGRDAVGRSKVNGVTIVNNPALRGAAPTLTLSDSVVRDIGGLKENAADEFNHNNGYLSGVALADGVLGVIDQFRVHLFDSTGRRVAVVGRAGLGPNEFAGLERICRMRGDTMIVFDQRRVSVVSAQGEIVRQSTIADLNLPATGCFDDGTIVTQSFSARPSDTERLSYAVRRRTDGSVVDTLGAFPLLEYRGVAQYIMLHAHGQFLYVSDPRQSDIRRYRQDGSSDQIVRLADEPRPMDANSAQQWLSGGAPMAAADNGGTGFANGTNKVMWPFYRALKIDGTGRLWVRSFPDDDTAPDRWTVYDTSGALSGRLDIPRSPPRVIANPRAGAPATFPGQAPELIDAFGDYVILLEKDSEGAMHFVTRRMLPINQNTVP